MLYEEAVWLGDKLRPLDAGSKRVLNVGSSSMSSRKVEQPHMNRFVFKPLVDKSYKVVHTDIRPGEGVDIVGDLTDPEFINELKSQQYDIVICTNVLEHVPNRAAIVEALRDLCNPGVFLVLSVPRIYPYHYDPIDTMYRPNLEQLVKSFPGFECIEGDIVKASRVQINKDGGISYQRNYAQMLKANPKLALLIFTRVLFPFYKPKMWWYTFKYLVMMFKPFQVTCAILSRSV